MPQSVLMTPTHYAAIVAHAPVLPRDSKRDGGFAVIDSARLQGRCFDCGDIAPLEFCHVAPSAGRVTSDGIALGGMGCRTCNLVHLEIVRRLGTDTLPYAYAAHLDVMPMGATTRAECVKAWADTRTASVSDMADERMARYGIA